MPTPTTTFRLLERDRRALDQLSEELACSRNETLRVALRLLRRDDAYRTQVRAASFARAFLDRLRADYGADAYLELDTGAEVPQAKINGQPASDLEVATRRSDHFLHLDLIDPSLGVGIFNAYVTDADEPRHLVIPLSAFYVPSPLEGSERETRVLPDGRTAVTVYEDNGESKSYVLDSDGRSSLLSEDTRAEFV